MSAHLEPEDEPGEAADDEEDVPEPEDEVHLVDDDVEAEDAEGVERHLPPPGAVLVVGAARNLDRMRSLKTTNIILMLYPWERLAHRVPGVLQQQLLGRQAVECVHIVAVGHEIPA